MRATTARRLDFATLSSFALLALLYNPLFNYEALLLRGFTGGAVRAALSLTVAIAIAAIQFVQRASPADPPTRRSVVIVGVVLALGTVRGLTNGASPRDVGGDLFPLAELYLYVALLSWMVRDRRSAMTGVAMLTAWVGIVAVIELMLYVRVGYLFSTKVPLGGCTLPRLDDFMPILFVPVGLAGAALLVGKLRYATGFTAAATASAVAISFFRTIWLAAAAGIVALIAGFVRDRSALTRVVLSIAFTGLAVLAALAALPSLLAFRPVCERPAAVVVSTPSPVGTVESPSPASPSPASPSPTVVRTPVALVTFTAPPIGDLMGGRLNPNLVQAEPASFGGRIQASLDMLRGIRDNPIFGVGFGGSFLNTTSHQVLPLSSAPNYFTAIAMELGIPATLALLIITALEIWRAARIAFTGLTPLNILGRGALAGLVGVLVSLAIFPALLHWAIGPYTALLLRAAKHARDPE